MQLARQGWLFGGSKVPGGSQVSPGSSMPFPHVGGVTTKLLSPFILSATKWPVTSVPRPIRSCASGAKTLPWKSVPPRRTSAPSTFSWMSPADTEPTGVNFEWTPNLKVSRMLSVTGPVTSTLARVVQTEHIW